METNGGDLCLQPRLLSYIIKTIIYKFIWRKKCCRYLLRLIERGFAINPGVSEKSLSQLLKIMFRKLILRAKFRMNSCQASETVGTKKWFSPDFVSVTLEWPIITSSKNCPLICICQCGSLLTVVHILECPTLTPARISLSPQPNLGDDPDDIESLFTYLKRIDTFKLI
jgi:hypothetical protein